MPLVLAWVDTRPHLFVLGLPLVALAVLGLRRLREHRVRWDVAVPVGFSIYLFAFWFVFAGPFLGVDRLMTYPMTWRMGEAGSEGASKLTSS